MSDPHDVALGARLLAIEGTMRILVEQASRSEAGVRERIRGTVEDYLSGLDQNAEVEQDFADRAREFIGSILRVPER